MKRNELEKKIKDCRCIGHHKLVYGNIVEFRLTPKGELFVVIWFNDGRYDVFVHTPNDVNQTANLLGWGRDEFMFDEVEALTEIAELKSDFWYHLTHAYKHAGKKQRRRLLRVFAHDLDDLLREFAETMEGSE